MTDPDQTPVNAFISYATRDNTLARRLVDLLRVHGQIHPRYRISFWFWDDDTVPGLPVRQFEDELKARAVIVQLLSPAWLTSTAVREIELPASATKIQIPLGLLAVPLAGVGLQIWRLNNETWFGDLAGSPNKQNEWAMKAVDAIAGRLDYEGWR